MNLNNHEKLKNIAEEIIGNLIQMIEVPQKTYALQPILFDKDNNVRKSNELGALGKYLPRKGVYFFLDENDNVIYVGQGGGGKTTTFKARILQELRISKKTTTARSTGALCENIHKKHKEKGFKTFSSQEDFAKHIRNWKVRVLPVEGTSSFLDLVEEFFISIYKPYNSRL